MEHATTSLLLRALAATGIAWGGGALGVALGRVAPRRLGLLVYAAAGALLAVTAFDVLPDAKALLPWPAFGAAAASGFALFWALGRYVFHLCPACAAHAFDRATAERLGQTAVLLLIALGVHSAMDGAAVAVGDEVAGRPDLALLLAVSFHKLPEGLALALLLLGAGYRRRAALGWALGIESLTMIGALAGVLGGRHAPPAALGLLFAHVGGGFVYLIASALGLSAGPPARGARQAAAPPRALTFLAPTGLAFTLTSGLIWTLRRLLP